jgi:hypothetical protein
MQVNHCQHGIEYNDPDGLCEQCQSEHSIPDWGMTVWKMKADLIQLEYRISKLEYRISKLEEPWTIKM